MAATYSDVRADGPLLRIKLTEPAPGRANFLTSAACRQLISIYAGVADKPEIRAVVLSATGPHFCGGGDRAEINQLVAIDPTREALREITETGRRLCEAILGSDVLTIASVHGNVVGAGLAVMLCCDLRVAAEGTSLRLPELSMGVAPAWGGTLGRLIGEVGVARAREMVLAGEWVDAATAQRHSLLHRVAPASEVDAVVAGWVSRALATPVSAFRAAKTLFRAHERASRMADLSLLDSQLMVASSVLGS